MKHVAKSWKYFLNAAHERPRQTEGQRSRRQLATNYLWPKPPSAPPVYTLWHLYQIMNGNASCHRNDSLTLPRPRLPAVGLHFALFFFLFLFLPASLIGHWPFIINRFAFVVMQKFSAFFCRLIGVIYAGIVKAEACRLCLSSYSSSPLL